MNSTLSTTNGKASTAGRAGGEVVNAAPSTAIADVGSLERMDGMKPRMEVKK